MFGIRPSEGKGRSSEYREKWRISIAIKSWGFGDVAAGHRGKKGDRASLELNGVGLGQQREGKKRKLVFTERRGY
jgi:hypothetical protein